LLNRARSLTLRTRGRGVREWRPLSFRTYSLLAALSFASASPLESMAFGQKGERKGAKQGEAKERRGP